MGTLQCPPNVLVPLMLMLQLQGLHVGMSNYLNLGTGGMSVNYSSYYYILAYFYCIFKSAFSLTGWIIKEN